MRKPVTILTVLLWTALLYQTWPSGGLTGPDVAGSAGLFIMLLMAVGLATLASFPLFATGVYLAAALLAVSAGSLGYAGLPFYYGLGLLVLTWLAFRQWRARKTATVAVPMLVDPSGKQLTKSVRRRSRAAPPRRRRAGWAWGVAGIAVTCLVFFVFQPSLPEVGAISLGAEQAGASVETDTTSAAASLEIVAYVDEVFWRVLAVESLGQAPEAAGPLAGLYGTGSQHIQVRVEVENRSDTPRPYTGFKLVDNQNGVTGRSLTSLLYVPNDERCVVMVLRPDIPQTCTEIFRLTENAAGLQARLNDLKLLGQGQEVEVPLGIPVSIGSPVDPQVLEDEPTLLERVLDVVMPAPIQPSARRDGNLRAGPSVEHAAVGSVAAGDTLELMGRNAAGDWYHLRSGDWIAALLVDDAPAGLPVVP